MGNCKSRRRGTFRRRRDAQASHKRRHGRIAPRALASPPLPSPGRRTRVSPTISRVWTSAWRIRAMACRRTWKLVCAADVFLMAMGTSLRRPFDADFGQESHGASRVVAMPGPLKQATDAQALTANPTPLYLIICPGYHHTSLPCGARQPSRPDA